MPVRVAALPARRLRALLLARGLRPAAIFAAVVGGAVSAPMAAGACSGPASCPRGLPAIDQHLIGTLLVHQAGSLTLADRAIPRLRDPRLRSLAEAIRERQRQDQTLLALWYRGWFGREAPVWTRNALPLPGLVLDPEALETAADLDRAYVAQVVPSLRFGLMLALQAQVHTGHPELIALEQQLVQRQSAEIRELEAWSLRRPAP